MYYCPLYAPSLLVIQAARAHAALCLTVDGGIALGNRFRLTDGDEDEEEEDGEDDISEMDPC